MNARPIAGRRTADAGDVRSGRVPAAEHASSAHRRAQWPAGGVLTLLACVALTAAGLYFDTTGGGPSDVLVWTLWGGLLVGLLLLVAAAVRSARGPH